MTYNPLYLSMMYIIIFSDVYNYILLIELRPCDINIIIDKIKTVSVGNPLQANYPRDVIIDINLRWLSV